VIGEVDELRRALLAVCLSPRPLGPKDSVRAWIDTAFNGGLVLPRREIARMGLKKSSTTEAILADGKTVELETYTCYLEWFGDNYRTQVVANDGDFPLLGTMLLENRVLSIDYRAKTLSLE
jgi:clan AA aspartic protease